MGEGCSGLGNMPLPASTHRVVCSSRELLQTPSINMLSSSLIALSLRNGRIENTSFSGLGFLERPPGSMLHPLPNPSIHVGNCDPCYGQGMYWCVYGQCCPRLCGRLRSMWMMSVVSVATTRGHVDVHRTCYYWRLCMLMSMGDLCVSGTGDGGAC